MAIIVTTMSIFAIAGFIWFANKILSSGICPICAGVAVTWLWILAGMYADFLKVENWQLVVAILMGGTIVGVAYRIEKRFPPHRSSLLWKTIFIPAGFVLIYGILTQWWNAALVSFVFLLLLSFVFLSSWQKTKNNNGAVEKLKEKMKDCC